MKRSWHIHIGRFPMYSTQQHGVWALVCLSAVVCGILTDLGLSMPLCGCSVPMQLICGNSSTLATSEFKLFVEIVCMNGVQERLQIAEKAVANAVKDPARASKWVNHSIAKEMWMHEENLSMVLAPFLHGDR